MKVLYVHGASVRDGAWWWSRMIEPLAALGHTTEVVELPSCGPEMTDMYADGDAVRAALDRADEPVILVGHSYGGLVIDDVAGHPAIDHIVYIATIWPQPGDAPPQWLEVRDGTVGVKPGLPPDLLPSLLFSDCPEMAPEAFTRVVRMSTSAFGQKPRGVVDVPTTYVVCTLDGWTLPERQRENAKRAGKVVELAAGHHPFISQPSALAAVL
jgi:pimeloyl-ACP methyl ester carboxylesterase